MSRYATGCNSDTLDERDHPLALHLLAECLGRTDELRALPLLPATVDIRDTDSPVRDQANLGACTGFGICAHREQLDRQRNKAATTTYSPLWLYYEERAIEQDVATDGGAQIRTGMKVALAQGFALEVDDPYNPEAFALVPSAKADEGAAANKISHYYRVPTLRVLKRTLAWLHPVVIGVDVYDSFEGDDAAKTGVIPVPLASEQLQGGHCIKISGYDDARGVMIFKNSWGTSWGDRGYGYLPYAMFAPLPWAPNDGAPVNDMWTAVL